MRQGFPAPSPNQRRAGDGEEVESVMTDESGEIRAAYDRFLAALSGGDHDRLMACFSRAPDTLLIGTAPEEWFASYDTVERVVKRLLPAIRRAGLSFLAGQ